jgi:hypothetical protein
MFLDINEPDQIRILSAYLQDAIIRVGDMAFLEDQRRFALMANRFCWEDCERENQRILCGFHFDGVQKVRYKGFTQKEKDLFVHLLAICFTPSEALEGHISLIFAGQNEIELQVEAVQVFLQDMGEAWQTKTRPQHEDK